MRGSSSSVVAFLVALTAGISSRSVVAAQDARRTVAVVAEGTGAPAIRRAIAGDLAAMAEIVSEATVTRAVTQTGGDLSAPFGRAALAREIEIDLLVRVTVRRSGRSTVANIEVFGADGRALGQREATGTGPRGRRTIATAARDLVQTTFTTLEEREAEAERRRVAAARAQREAADGDDDDDDDDDDAGNASAERLAVLAGFGGRVRSLDIDFAEGVVSTHESGFFPELSLLVRVRPLATSMGFARGIYGAVGFGLGLGVSATDAMGETISSTVIRFHLDAGWSQTLGPIELGATLGFGLDSFSFDRDVIVPSSSFTYLRLGPSATLAVDRAGLLALGLTAGLRLAFGAGDLSAAYGGTPAIGFDLALVATGHLGRFVYGADVGLSLWSLSFDDTNADGMTATSGSELGFGGRLMAGFQIL